MRGKTMITSINNELNWQPVFTKTLFAIPTEHFVVRMENIRTKEHAYFDVKRDRFLSQQEAFDYLKGY
jgi:hypothetical protein